MTDDINRKQGNKEHKKSYSATGEKLELRKKMGTITMVTPPSFFQNQNRSFCLINLSKKDKDNFATEINKYFPKDARCSAVKNCKCLVCTGGSMKKSFSSSGSSIR